MAPPPLSHTCFRVDDISLVAGASSAVEWALFQQHSCCFDSCFSVALELRVVCFGAERFTAV
jgi:hypothetical protein